ncbi:hypothetical protein [Simkania negevensis]|uniref:Heparin-sulfate lyase N-terminal domain-containing protein n=1 Tax=Simkania negevensis (strain ATCC VR-1471 / DSM 27360 / Z) TaxID=331113 RepID=F8L7E5_SIMNZ|nr:hypothetical protein [Simkania negevensis]CCB88676.1 hypothetical protein SNE_A07990 [Simkania negevensis Z]
MRDLVTFYRDRLHLLSEEDNWCRALKNCYLQKPVDESLIRALLDECRDVVVDSPQDYLLYLRKLVSLSFLHRFQPMPTALTSLQKIYHKIYTQGFWKEFQLGEALYALGCYLVGLPMPALEPKQLAKGGILVEAGNHLPDGGIPHPLLNAELALIWLFLGWEEDNESLIHAALKWAYISLGLFDHENRPFHGVWLREAEYRPLPFNTVYFLLFSVASEMLLSSKTGHLADALFDALKEVEDTAFQMPPVFLLFFALGFESLHHDKACPEIIHSYSMSEVDKSLGYLATKQNDLSLACSFSGVNTGLGALHKTHVRIVSFGPHFTPLADSDRYGVYRTSSGVSDPFRDLEYDKKGGSFQVKGWARLISPYVSHVYHHNLTLTQPGKQWLYFSAAGDGDKIFFESRLSEFDEKHPLFFAYFITADKAHVEGKETLTPATLHRYQGQSRAVSFEKGEERLFLDPKMDTEMHVIPLAGSHHFWGADFLVAFPLEETHRLYRWEIK